MVLLGLAYTAADRHATTDLTTRILTRVYLALAREVTVAVTRTKTTLSVPGQSLRKACRRLTLK